MIKVKRIYEDPADDDGFRVLVDRLWPGGQSGTGVWLKVVSCGQQELMSV